MVTKFVLGSLVLALVGCSRQEEPKQVRVPPPVPGPNTRDFQTPWQSESEYIVTMVAADLTEMAYYAKHGRALAQTLPVEVREIMPSPATGPVYQIKAQLGEAGEVACDLPIQAAIWAPATYRPFVEALLSKLQVVGSDATAVPDGTLLGRLQAPRAEVLAKADLELSGQLAREFTVAGRHEEAALLLGSFALRQTDGLFFQIRVELCRMAAHLAFADGLRGKREASLTGRLAEATLTALYNNQVSALEQLAPVAEDGDAGAWKRALRMRVTGDFRIIGESRTRTLLEEFEWFRARSGSVDVKWAWASLRLGEEQQSLADWTRIASAADPNVEIGHTLVRVGLPLEYHEIGLAYEAEQGKPLPEDQLVEALNAEPQRCVTGEADGRAQVRIIGWGTWAAFLQRQLCQALVTNFLVMRDKWGVRDDARKFQEEIDGKFWGLRLYPFVRRQCAPDHSYYKKAQDDQMALVRRSPHVVPSSAWNYICYEVPFGPIYWPPPHPFLNEWHRPNPPPGTAYNPLPRMNQPSLVQQPDIVARLERMHQLAPYDEVISHNLLRIRDGEKQTAAQVEQVYAAGLEYQANPLGRLGRLAKDPVQREGWIRKSAAVDPSEYRTLAQFYRDQGREDDAAQAYVEWIGNETDEVLLSNSVEWLVKYFERKGDLVSAGNLADRAAAAYSATGLLTKARFLERRKDLAGAVDLHQKQAERYDSYGPFIGFLVRQKEAGNTAYDKLRESLLKEHLPAGLIKFDQGASPVAPKVGVRVPSRSPRMEAAGLRFNDIVVAVRGYRVPNWPGFKVLRNLEPDVPYVITVWREEQYVDLPPIDAGYRFGVDLVDYRAK